ncbi:uncharacterized protein At3g52155, chloroplastic isoform X3 [Durio zibethinus]|uniref:Uncharacterized protein At3g52155, chloroplastic isoform X3 n=1 Tax=Durio zibethinus TaxID=66656 RepID=A0A6P5X9H0_DURZI|nr:uncharacterized protein At3g52155, chloroplastic isoform X3 [Durio zibethinus]
MNGSATVAVGICPSTSKPLSIGLSPIPIRLRWRRRRCLMIEVEAEPTRPEAQSVSRRLILLRHAKSSWNYPALRAMDGQTAEHLQRTICQYSRDEILTIMCMGHNRGWEEAASMFTGASIELKTCNAALLEATGKSWEEWSGLKFFLKTGYMIDAAYAGFLSLFSFKKKRKAFAVAGFGGWKLQGIVTPSSNL